MLRPLTWYGMLMLYCDIDIVKVSGTNAKNKTVEQICRFTYIPSVNMWEMEGGGDELFSKSDIRNYYQGKRGYKFKKA